MVDDPQSANASSPESSAPSDASASSASASSTPPASSGPFGDPAAADGEENASGMGDSNAGDSGFGKGAGPGHGSSGPSWGREAPGTGTMSGEAHDPAQEWVAQAKMGWSMARFWVRQNQTTALLGALAVGTFVGAMLRD